MVKVRKRSVVLRYALNLERIASDIAAYLLDIEDPRKSHSFGNKSSALSFNQKLNLLLDNNTISKDDKVKLEAFSSIRNQFMHNIDANSYAEAFDPIDGLENKMKKLYPENFIGAREDNLEKCITSLYKDSFSIFTSMKGGVERKIKVNSDATIYKEYFTELESSVKKNLDDIERAFRQHDQESINKKKILNMLKLLKIQIFTDSVTNLSFLKESKKRRIKRVRNITAPANSE